MFVINYASLAKETPALTGCELQSNVQRSISDQNYLYEHGSKIFIIALKGYVFFGSAHTLFNQVRDRFQDAEQYPSFVILDFSQVDGVDSSAILSFSKMSDFIKKSNSKLIFSDVSSHITELSMEKNEGLSSHQLCKFVSCLDYALEWCEEVLLSDFNNAVNMSAFDDQLTYIFPQPQQRDIFKTYLEKVYFEKGENLCHFNDISDGLYFIVSGELSAVVDLKDGKQMRLRKFLVGAIVGEIGLFTGSRRTTSIVANKKCSLYFLSIQAFETMVTKDPLITASFNKFIIKLLSERLVHSNKVLERM